MRLNVYECSSCGLSSCRCVELGIKEDLTQRPDCCADCKDNDCAFCDHHNED